MPRDRCGPCVNPAARRFALAKRCGLSFRPDQHIISPLTRRLRELGVRYVLEGSVQRSGNPVRVSTQLIDAETDTHLWADRLDRDAGDLFAL